MPTTIPPHLRPTGALPPYEPWHKDKTPESIDFVDAAERFIKANAGHKGNQILQEAIERIKQGKEVLKSLYTPEKYIQEVEELGN